MFIRGLDIILKQGMSSTTSSNIARACAVFCEGPLLHYVQVSGIFNDSKTFVDMPLKVSPETVTAAFAAIPDPTDTAALKDFLDAYFDPAGSDLDVWEPTDLQTAPSFLDSVDAEYKQWGDDLNQLWKLLGYCYIYIDAYDHMHLSTHLLHLV